MEWGFGAGELVVAPDLAAALEPLARAFTAWEVTGEGPFATQEGVARIAAVLPSFRLRVTYHASFREVDLAAPDPRARERDAVRIAQQVAWARGLGAEAVVAHPGKRIRGLADPRAEERCRASLGLLAAAGREHGVEVRVENMPQGSEELGQGGAGLAALAEVTGAACWDLGHARTYRHTTDAAPPHALVREVHLHHNRGANDDHLPLEASDPWWRAALEALDRPRLLVVMEHRRALDCLASLQVARSVLASPHRGLAP